MAVYQKNKIQEDVRTALDQNMNSDTLKIIGDVDTLALDDIIASKILETGSKACAQLCTVLFA